MAWDNPPTLRSNVQSVCTSQITSNVPGLPGANDGNSSLEVTHVGNMITLKTILPLVRCSLARLVSQRGHMAGRVKFIQWF
jgi:hypothetical protein